MTSFVTQRDKENTRYHQMFNCNNNQSVNSSQCQLVSKHFLQSNINTFPPQTWQFFFNHFTSIQSNSTRILGISSQYHKIKQPKFSNYLICATIVKFLQFYQLNHTILFTIPLLCHITDGKRFLLDKVKTKRTNDFGAIPHSSILCLFA